MRAHMRYLHCLGRSCQVLADGTFSPCGGSIAYAAEERSEIQWSALSWSGAAVQLAALVDRAVGGSAPYSVRLGYSPS